MIKRNYLVGDFLCLENVMVGDERGARKRKIYFVLVNKVRQEKFFELLKE